MKNLDQFANAYANIDDTAYEYTNIMANEAYQKRILETMGENISVMELGLGSGLSSIRMNKIVNKFVVVEGSKELINIFLSRHPATEITILNSYFEQLETDQKFDVISLYCVLEHVDNPLIVLNHMKKFLKDDGMFFIAVPNWESLNKKIAYEAGMINDMHQLSALDMSLGHQRTFNLDIFNNLLAKANLSIEFLEGAFLKPITTSQMQALGFDDHIYNALVSLGKDYPELSNIMYAGARLL